MTFPKIKLLPNVLIRLAGMSFEVLNDLEFSEMLLNQLNELKKLELNLSNSKQDLLILLKKYKTDFPYFKSIREVKKMVHKERFINLHLFKYLEEDKVDKILIFNNLINKKNKLKDELEENFNRELRHIQQSLQKLSKNDNLQNALPLSSLVFAKQYLKYLEKKPLEFRKKEQQVQQSTLQYLIRTAAKTSPFSSFTPVCYGELTTFENENNFDTKEINLELNRHLEWNNYLLELLKKAFVKHPQISPYLPIRLNRTLKSDETNYIFLINQQNIERFQTLEKQAILEIFETIISSNSVLQIQFLVQKIMEEIEVEATDLMIFIKELIQIGFLEIQFPFHQKSSIWLNELITFAEDIPFLKMVGIPVFENMKCWIKQFETADLSKRIKILERSFIEIKHFLSVLNHEKTVDLKSIISPEQLIYEDTAYQGLMKINQTKTENLIFKLNQLLTNLNFIKGQERLQITHFFDTNYQPNEIVSVLDFYESYYKKGKLQLEKTSIKSIETEAKLINDWVKSVAELLVKKYKKTGKVNLEIADFELINQQLKISPVPLKDSSFTCFTQLFETQGELKAVLNAVSLGFGKMSGRFLDLMPKSFYENLVSFNKKKTKNFIKVENTDAAFFNANHHQALLDFELSSSNNVSEDTGNRQIKITDLFIKRVDNELIIWHKQMQKQLQFYDLGIQTTKGRSPLYRLLLNFKPIIPSFHYLEIAFQKFQKKLNLEDHFSPAIYYGNWILKRKSWKLPTLETVESFRNLSPINSYQKWQDWQMKNHYFYKNYYLKNILSQSNERLKKIKPSYINFNNLISLNHGFHRNDKRTKALQIEEMKPNEKELLKISNQKYVSEFVIQWYNE